MCEGDQRHPGSYAAGLPALRGSPANPWSRLASSSAASGAASSLRPPSGVRVTVTRSNSDDTPFATADPDSSLPAVGVLRSPNGDSEDQLVCHFNPDDVDTVGEFTDGLDVTLEGKFQEYSEDEGVVRVVLADCSEK